MISVLVSMTISSGCGVSGENSLPPDVQDPVHVQTPEGAMAFYRGVLAALPLRFEEVLSTAGIVTDELAALPISVGGIETYTMADSRSNLEVPVVQGIHEYLHRLRAQAREARGFLMTYASDSSPALRGHLYAVEGYAEVFLADLFCSGIPLSTVDFQGDFTLAAGSSTAEIYTHAIFLFDTALALTGDSLRLQQVAEIGKARALLALGRYAEAATAASAVPDDYAYEVVHSLQQERSLYGSWQSRNNQQGRLSAADREGLVGLDYRSSGDPRTAQMVVGSDFKGNSMYTPTKYPLTGSVTYAIATGIEARLIEAEAALQANPDDGRWLELLNHLRQTSWPSIKPAAGGPLPDLPDPESHAGRVNLLFQERAFWLYLTAHRQGDLRRLIRQYLRAPNEVYPTGGYPGGSGVYGDEIVVPVPESERELNPKYMGCFNRNA